MTTRRPRASALAADLAELERRDMALAAAELDRVTRAIARLPAPAEERAAWRSKTAADVARALEAKARREAEAETWIAGVRARKDGKR